MPLRLSVLVPLLISHALWAAAPPDYVPARWKSTDPRTLALLRSTPINCLLLEWTPNATPAMKVFAAAAQLQKVDVLAVIHRANQAQLAAASGVQGIVLEGDDSTPLPPHIPVPVIALTSRQRMNLAGNAPVLGTYQGVWPGVRPADAAHAGPTGNAWIDTNHGFLGFARSWGNHTIWIANTPPKDAIVTPARYMQVIADAAITGSRWVIDLDDDFSRKLYAADPRAMDNWKRIVEVLQYYEDLKEYRTLNSGAQLAVVQEAKEGALLSGGILDMMAAKHTPAQAIPPAKLDAAALNNRQMAVDIDSSRLSPAATQTLKLFQEQGGTVLNGPPEWKAASRQDPGKITLNDDQLKRVDRMWHEMSEMIGRKNLGVRLFNVSTMLATLLATPDRKQVYVGLVNYSDYPVENVTMHVLGHFTKAFLLLPGGIRKSLETYEVQEGTGVDVDSVGVAATICLQ